MTKKQPLAPFYLSADNTMEEITVGMPCTYRVGSDRYPAFVSRVSDSGKTVWIREADYKPDVENGYNYFSNQVHIITPNNNNRELTVRKAISGWRLNQYNYVSFGHARRYMDPHF